MMAIIDKMTAPGELCASLKEICDQKFLEKKGCYLLRALWSGRYEQYKLEMFGGETGLEAFVNSIHVSDYCNEEIPAQAYRFIECVRARFREQFGRYSLCACASVSDDDFVVKFYLKRQGQIYLSDDLNMYEQAIMEIN